MTPKAAPPASTRLDSRNTEKQIESALGRLTSGERRISKATAKGILAFIRAREGEVSRQRTLTYANHLASIAEELGKDFLEPTRKTPAKFREVFGNRKGWTQKSYWGTLAKFWKWQAEQEGTDYPSYLRFKVGSRLLSHKDESSVISPEEVARLAAATTTVRDRAFVLCLYESGARVGEILGLRIRDVTRSEHGGFSLHVDGKTGKRTVPLFESSVPALSAWLATHPAKDEPASPLWVSTQATDRLGEPVGYGAMLKVVRLAAKRAGIEKPVNPHNFRHSRATAVAQNAAVSTSILEKFFGWRAGSAMASTYVHVSGREVEEVMARAIGVEKVESPKPSAAIPRTCLRCSFVNDATNKFCGTCGSPLDLLAAEELGKVEANAKTLASLLQRPEVVEYLATQLAKSTA